MSRELGATGGKAEALRSAAGCHACLGAVKHCKAYLTLHQRVQWRSNCMWHFKLVPAPPPLPPVPAKPGSEAIAKV